MKVDFLYSTDFQAMNAPELSHTCMHALALHGWRGQFCIQRAVLSYREERLVVIPYPARISNIAAHADMQVEWFAADYKFLQNLLPSNNCSISLNQDPVIKLTDEQAGLLLADFHRLRDRMGNRHLLFYRKLMGSLCLTMMYDIFEPHAQRVPPEPSAEVTHHNLRYIIKALLYSLVSMLEVACYKLKATRIRLTIPLRHSEPSQRKTRLRRTRARSRTLPRMLCSLKRRAPKVKLTITLLRRTIETMETMASGRLRA